MNARRATTIVRDTTPLQWKRALEQTWPIRAIGRIGRTRRIRPISLHEPTGGGRARGTHTRMLTPYAPYAAALAAIVVMALLLSYGARRIAQPLALALGDGRLASSVTSDTSDTSDAHGPSGGAPSPGAPRGSAHGPRGVQGTGKPAGSAAAARTPASTAGAAMAGAIGTLTQGILNGGAPMPPAIEELRRRHLSLPVNGVRVEQLVPTFDEARGDRPHEAIDIMAARGTPVVATEGGRIAKLFWSKAGGHTIYQFDPTERYVYYYAHLDRYADELAEGQTVTRGQTIGYVGSTGNAQADAPHLHFAIFLLTPEKRWWDGAALDPYPVLRWNIDGGTP